MAVITELWKIDLGKKGNCSANINQTTVILEYLNIKE